ncbi:aspartate kinase [Sediminibacterium roseum]|uniref:Aspartokinase n=1 Tax=Sediminibacterium roseum TaxID=1978412 RepID=A0ABW9ZYK0_9BACT|nr:aspartate kinase [Sediminibacterium roseum]NCI49941.1 aspartate kinase [Sediminibacterium roseum]
MKVFKFGGASVNSVERIRNLAGIVKLYNNEPLVVIISAMGKTTNGLEKVVESFYAGNRDEALQLFEAVKQHHLNIAKYLLVTHFNKCLSQLTDFFTEVEWLLHDKPVREFDYYYDQVVCVGELLSTSIVSHYLNETKIENEWLDVRDLVRTDNNFRDAGIDWAVTEERVKNAVGAGSPAIHVTQGFIGSTDDNESTTLGREGSDYTAAIFANILNAESLSIWKDVEGVMNADPKLFPEAQLIPELNFTEVIEMAYYGAQVIHPKTIKPLQNKGIPLHVKCFLDPSLPGTVIHRKNIKHLPPIVVIKENQSLLHLNSQDFSFVGEEPMSRLYQLFGKIKLRPNLIQTGAISVQVCLDFRAEKIDQLASEAAGMFDVQVEKELSLLTIRHYNTEILEKLTSGKNIVLTQRTKETVQVLFK